MRQNLQAYLMGMFEDTNLCAIHVKRVKQTHPDNFSLHSCGPSLRELHHPSPGYYRAGAMMQGTDPYVSYPMGYPLALSLS